METHKIVHGIPELMAYKNSSGFLYRSNFILPDVIPTMIQAYQM